ncbi:MAG: response regulator [Phormidesmis sp.]
MVDREQEIRLQFLDEAGEYLDTLETALIGIAQNGVDTHQINGALRAAHSIKGGAALMGYGLTSKLAHRLEDSLKVLKIQRTKAVSSELEGQLLSGVDAIRQVVERDRKGPLVERSTGHPIDEHPTDEQWVKQSVLPIFDGLYDALGEPSAEDAASIMDTDEGQNVLPLIFQTEVDGSLERLATLVDEQPASLREDIITMSQELGSLGEMLDLPLFIQLCQSVERYASGAANVAQVKEVARKTLQVWRRAQALVLTGNADAMPNQLTGISFGLIDIELEGSSSDRTHERPATETALEATSATENLPVDNPLSTADDALVEDVFAGLGAEDDALVGDVFAGLGAADSQSDWVDEAAGTEASEPLDSELEAEVDAFAGVFDEADTAQWTGNQLGRSQAVGPSTSQPASQPNEPSDSSLNSRQPDDQPATQSAGTQFRFSQTPQAQADDADLGDNTVRVSVRKLNELNDYFGELTIERNRLDAEVKRMRSLVSGLSRKLRSLDETYDDINSLYEQPENARLLTGAGPAKALPGSALAVGADNGGTSISDTASATSYPQPDTRSDRRPAPQTDRRLDNQTDHQTSSQASNQVARNFRQAFDSSDFDALEFDRYTTAHLPFRQILDSLVQLQEVSDDIELSVDKTEQTARTIHRTVRHLQRNLNQLRMRPLSDVTNRFPRALRELEREHGKSVDLQLEGENILIDRNILEALNDPLMHIVRNAFDHGIEMPAAREKQGKPGKGTIAIRAFNRNSRTFITIGDDGNGISLEKIRDRARSMGLDADLLNAASEADLLSLIFEPGFSTSDQVTALSGRGVGMDVVRNNLTQIRGDISVNTEAGQGTTFTISVPYTLSVTRVMLAEGNRLLVALPTDMIEEVTVIDPGEIFEIDGREMFSFKRSPVRLIRLSNWMAFNCPRQIDSLEDTPTIDGPSILIFRVGEQKVGLQIDRSWGDQEVAVRRIEGPISLPAGFSNCTILGDGRVVPLINPPELVRWVMSCEATNVHSAEELYTNPMGVGAIHPMILQTPPSTGEHRTPRFLVIDDSLNVRRLLALTLEKAGYEVEQARDGQDAFEKLETGLGVDSIVCDIEMPRMDGYSFLSKLRSQPAYADIPVTMLTSRSSEKHRNLAMNLGATAYLSKPYQERVLLKSLAESLANAQAKEN